MPFSIHEPDEDNLGPLHADTPRTIHVPADTLEARVDFILAQIKREVMRAARKHRAMAGAHEGYAVILEELDELWDHVKADTGQTPAAAVEAMQVAAMGVRYLLDVTPRDALPYLEKQ